MNAQNLAESLIETLPIASSTLFNPYLEVSADDLPDNTPQIRVKRLAEHLDCLPRLVLIGEAPGYQGCRLTGVAFTSERLLLEGRVPRVRKAHGRLSSRTRPWSEPSATIVWNALDDLRIADCTVMWNALQMHPHIEGSPLSNRAPTPEELCGGTKALQLLRNAFPQAKFVAVGRKAETALRSSGIDLARQIRHPANGGKTEFLAGLRSVV